MRIIFAGTPPFAAKHLQALFDAQDSDFEVVAVYTQPDRKAGRGKKLLPSPVKQLALEHAIPVEQPLSLKDSTEQSTLAAYNADVMVVAAYGMLLPEAVLSIPTYGCINVHASLLPRWRGAAPVERAIMAGDSETGVTIMQMDVGLDTGDMLLKAHCSIDDNETGDSLREKLIEIGKPALLNMLNAIRSGSISAEKQDDAAANYAKKLDKSEMQIDWQQSAIENERKVRALTSALSCYTLLNEQRIRIVSCKAIEQTALNVEPGHIKAEHLEPGYIELISNELPNNKKQTCLKVSCSSGYLLIDTVQIPGGKAMSLDALLNGKPSFFATGMRFELI